MTTDHRGLSGPGQVRDRTGCQCPRPDRDDRRTGGPRGPVGRAGGQRSPVGPTEVNDRGRPGGRKVRTGRGVEDPTPPLWSGRRTSLRVDSASGGRRGGPGRERVRLPTLSARLESRAGIPSRSDVFGPTSGTSHPLVAGKVVGHHRETPFPRQNRFVL